MPNYNILGLLAYFIGMQTITLSNEQAAFLKSNYHIMTWKQLKTHFGLSRPTLSRLADFYGLPPKGRSPELVNIGEVISNLRIIEKSVNVNKEGKPLWTCECLVCGRIFERRANTLNAAKNTGRYSACIKCSIKYSTALSHRKTFTHKGNTYNSSWELVLAIILDVCNIDFCYEPEIFDLELCGIAYKYIPDFYLRQYGLWLEVKGNIETLGVCKFEEFSKTHNAALISQAEFVNLIPISKHQWQRRVQKLTTDELVSLVRDGIDETKISYFLSLLESKSCHQTITSN